MFDATLILACITKSVIFTGGGKLFARPSILEGGRMDDSYGSQMSIRLIICQWLLFECIKRAQTSQVELEANFSREWLRIEILYSVRT